ncbi:hypothetical protein [Amaricoccus macauensis]|uniref:hypothetical protein n=1 Tax=Amaricoccus macauensis TaxID=57001 RepID=UPI003C7ADB54
MNGYTPFFRLDLSHDFFGSAQPPITILPDRQTVRLAHASNLRIRTGTGWVEVYAPDDRSNLQEFAHGGGLEFTLRLRAQNPTLASVTSAIAEATGMIAVIERDHPESGSLQVGETLSTADLRPLEVDGLIEDQDLKQQPLAIMRLMLGPDTHDARYNLRFGAAERFWTYHVTGSKGNATMGIRDKTDAVSFEALGQHVLSNGMRATSFRSKAPIPARANPGNRFELISEGPHGHKVLLSALPCPKPGSDRIEENGSNKCAVSEVYLNLL